MLLIKRIYWKWLYRKIENSFIYEVVRNAEMPDQITLFGPLKSETIMLASKKGQEERDYSFVQVINGMPMTFFKKDELLFSRKRI